MLRQKPIKSLISIVGTLMLTPTTSLANDHTNNLSSKHETVIDSDGNSYRSVKIGEQIWLAENLRTTKFQNGTMVRH